MVTPASATFDAQYPMPSLGYRYEFGPHEAAAIEACNNTHGFAIARGVIDTSLVEELRASVHEACTRDGELAPGQTKADLVFVEHSPALRKLLEHDRYMRLFEGLMHTDELTVHRSACIMKMPGAGPVGWHSDHSYCAGPPRDANEVMNQSTAVLGGSWLYLDGTRPHRAGLAVLEGSHVVNWPGPEGFELTQEGKTFRRPGSEASGYDEFDVPRIVPLWTEPGDMIFFHARTQHAAFPHRGDRPRYSCGLGFRPGRAPWDVPWPLSAAAEQMKRDIPQRQQPYFEHYTSIEPGWRREQAEPAPTTG